MAAFAERVKDTTTTTGTGTVTLAGSAPTGFRTFASAYGAESRQVRYAIVDAGTGDWEAGRGTFDGTTGLARDSVESSSNSGSLVSFAAGTKDVFVTVLSSDVGAGSIGRSLAIVRGLAMP